MQRLLRRACHAANLAREQDLPLRPVLIALIERCYDAIVADGLAFHEHGQPLAKARPRGRPPRRVGHNLLLRLSTRKPDVLRFLTDPSVPFTNNLAERDGRMMKLRYYVATTTTCIFPVRTRRVTITLSGVSGASGDGRIACHACITQQASGIGWDADPT